MVGYIGKCFIGKAFLFLVLCMLVLPGISNASDPSQQQNNDDAVTKVICNVVVFVQKLGLPIMTGVILGSSIMAIFGRLPWPAIVMLVVFTAIFFGAGKLISRFAGGVQGISDAKKFDCTEIAEK
ncbi:TrbC/VirB2 family protein [Ehrlichia ruminantium]|uniref:TrbC/VirB2 family protein n=1 Tax=Ehrlichia ruminantium TaxID=779 RepID=UPI0007A0842D|nr:TrbC/VirB2 family protein [Ehrlichia ruminantium]KYW91685.1 type VI secretion protein [Ehrlichia ruminantium]QLK50891.1 TrbC/VirB2 family protein [Ehrlichia ruminantium]QLK51813.1 TrbC/VirB2 family protein [Ehrlichia ruminantium]QLK53652.1 TrbC/VirB2 family protein [Ehrlichia ruminantium]